MEHQAKREAGVDDDRRIDWLTAPLSGSRSMPGLHGFLGYWLRVFGQVAFGRKALESLTLRRIA